MKNIIFLILISFMLSGCTLFRTHKMDIQQGNVINEHDVARLRPGMTEQQVKNIMGNPVLVNIFTPNRVDYVYTYQPGYGHMHEQRVICLFRGRILKEVITE